MLIKERMKKTYVYSANTDKDCDLTCDRPVLSSGRTPHDKENRNCPDYSPRGADR